MPYTGETNSKGEPHGQGTMTFADGSTYTGAWKDDKFNGQGIHTGADGGKYAGEFKDDELVP